MISINSKSIEPDLKQQDFRIQESDKLKLAK